MPFAQNFPLGGTGDLIMELVQRVEVLEAKQRALQNGAINVVDGNNITRAVLGQLSDGSFGLDILDSNGNTVVRIGQQQAGGSLYGVAVAPLNGVTTQQTLQMVGGAVIGAVTGATLVSNTTWAAFSPTGQVTANIGPSGSALVTISGALGTAAAGVEPIVALSIDGVSPGATSGLSAPYPMLSIAESVGAGGVSGASSVTFVQTGLAQGNHTFAPQYYVANGGSGSANFYQIKLVVQPL